MHLFINIKPRRTDFRPFFAIKEINRNFAPSLLDILLLASNYCRNPNLLNFGDGCLVDHEEVFLTFAGSSTHAVMEPCCLPPCNDDEQVSLCGPVMEENILVGKI